MSFENFALLSSVAALLVKVAKTVGVRSERKQPPASRLRCEKEEIILLGLFTAALIFLRRNPVQIGVGVASLVVYHRLSLQHFDLNKALLSVCKQSKHSASTLHCIKKYINNGADINVCDPQGRSALVILLANASGNGTHHFQIVQLLIDSGIDVNSISISQMNALFYLIQNKQLDVSSARKIVQLLVQKGIEVNHSNSTGRNALMQLFSTDNPSVYDIAETLIKEGAIDVNHIDHNEENALFILLGSKTLKHSEVNKVLDLLINAGINVKQVNNRGENSICRLFKFRSIPFEGYLEITRKLIELGADLNCSARHRSYKTASCFGDRFFEYLSSSTVLKDSPLVQESLNLLGSELRSDILIKLCKDSHNVFDIVSLFCRTNVSFDCEDHEGSNPLIALFKNSKARSDAILKTAALLKSKVKINHVDNRGNNALMTAIESNHYCLLEMVRLLINETDVHQVNLSGENVLIKFCRQLSGFKEIPFFSEEAAVQLVELLISRGIDVDHCDENDCNALLSLFSSPLHRNAIPYVKSITSLLTKHGANLNSVDALQENVLCKLAKDFNNIENLDEVIDLATLLIESGVNVSIPDQKNPLLTLLTRARDSSPRTPSAETVKSLREALLHTQSQAVKLTKNMKMFKLLSAALNAGMPANLKNASGEYLIEILCDFYQGDDFLDVVELLCNNGIELKNDDGRLWVQIVFRSVRNFDVGRLSAISLLLSERGLTVPALSENSHQREVAEQVVRDLLH